MHSTRMLPHVHLEIGCHCPRENIPTYRELELEIERLHQELADAHSAHLAVAELLREAYEQQSDALDSAEMKEMSF